ncbi:MAG: GTPase HflX [Clostridia bacterium]|jgi:GTP-binding protein HflX|nr:GTPase HflX [Clostridia bacterium]
MEQKTKAILVGVYQNNYQDFMISLDELFYLAEACDIEVVDKVTQKLSRMNPSCYIGAGKIQEVRTLMDENDADVAIFNDELSPSQIRNLEKALGRRVIDRTMLILDIFAQRARTREAQLQVEIAKLQYMLPRLIRLGESMDRQGGGAGLKNRGAGETRLELDRRKIEDKISRLTKELEILVLQRQNQRKMRKKKELRGVALVGYTNAGKSTVMNAMVDLFNGSADKQVFEKNMLFATLETSVRSIKLPDNKSFLLTDTVGFINKLPHHLVKAFRSTLEEVTEADMLIHVVDYANPHYKDQMEVTRETLSKLGANHIPVVYVYNKMDLVDELEKVNDKNNCIYISAKKREGVDLLINAICANIFKEYVFCRMLIPYDKGEVLAYLNSNASVKAAVYESQGILVDVECKESDYERYKHYIK